MMLIVGVDWWCFMCWLCLVLFFLVFLCFSHCFNTSVFYDCDCNSSPNSDFIFDSWLSQSSEYVDMYSAILVCVVVVCNTLIFLCLCLCMCECVYRWHMSNVLRWSSNFVESWYTYIWTFIHTQFIYNTSLSHYYILMQIGIFDTIFVIFDDQEQHHFFTFIII